MRCLCQVPAGIDPQRLFLDAPQAIADRQVGSCAQGTKALIKSLIHSEVLP